MRIACSQYALDNLAGWDSYANKMEVIAQEAKQQSADLLLLPEYAGTEIVGQHATDIQLFAAIQPLLPQYLNFCQTLASRYQFYLQPGTIVVEIAPRQYVNRAYFFTPNGGYGYQDKLQLVEAEKSVQVLVPGQIQTLFDTTVGKIGVAICYDSEFPALVRRLTEAGAQLILVPSYTSSLASYHRVSICCRARAVENQCYVALSCVVGAVALSDAAETTTGKAAIFAPVNTGFSDDGIMISGVMDKKMMLTVDLDLEKISFIRTQGQTHNFEDTKCCENIMHRKVNMLHL